MRQIDAIEQELEPAPTSVRAARRTVAQVVADVVPQEHLDSLLLATSEVVTNAVEHGGPPIALVIAKAEDRVRIEVRDGSPLLPRPGTPEPTDIRGRGVRIVEGCADRWGVEPIADGKRVWFEFDLRGR